MVVNPVLLHVARTARRGGRGRSGAKHARAASGALARLRLSLGGGSAAASGESGHGATAEARQLKSIEAYLKHENCRAATAACCGEQDGKQHAVTKAGWLPSAAAETATPTAISDKLDDEIRSRTAT